MWIRYSKWHRWTCHLPGRRERGSWVAGKTAAHDKEDRGRGDGAVGLFVSMRLRRYRHDHRAAVAASRP